MQIRTTPQRKIEDVIGIDATDAIACSAKTGMGIDDILEAIVAKIPAPKGNPNAPLRAMIIDSWFDSYVGVVMLVRVVDGRLGQGRAHQDDGHRHDVQRRQPGRVHARQSTARRRWRRARWVTSSRASRSCKRPRSATPSPSSRRGTGGAALTDTSACLASRKSSRRCLPACTPPKPIEYDSLRDALEKLKLNDCLLALRARGVAGAWVSAFAAASWACCTWKSCKSVWSGSSTKT